jgi:amino acid permease
MPPDETGFLSREELLAGLPARRASTLLFAIESRTARLVDESRLMMVRFIPERTVAARERAFLEALAQGRDLPLAPTIQDLERYSGEWAPLVPEDHDLRAALAQALSRKYRFTAPMAPGIRAALGLDSLAVREAYGRLYHEPLSVVYAEGLGLGERWRWLKAGVSARLETLPPFWTAFALTLTETVGAGILALPIALAGVGPLAGVILLLVLGVVNILTIAGIAEAIVRNGNMRYGHSYFGRLVGDYLGHAGKAVLTPALLLLNFLALLAYYIGIAATLADATGLRAELFAALLFLVGLYFLRRETLDATIASALVVGAINLGLIIMLSLLALPHVSAANLLYINVPFVAGRPLDAAVLALIFGVVLSAYFGHTSAANAAKVVLRRDPSGRALILGNVAALTAAVGLFCLWVLAVNGAVAPEALAATSATALTPLAAEAGPAVLLLGSAFVVLGMGMASIHMSLGLFFQVREWLSAGRAVNPRGRFWLSVTPVILVFLLVEWLLISGQESFAGLLSFLGTITVPLLAGIFPVLMLLASRRRGDCLPSPVLRALGHPLTIIAVYLVFLSGLVLHGLIIWQDPFQRAIALLAAVVIVGVTVAAWRQGAFKPRAILELRVDERAGGRAFFNIAADGRALVAAIRLRYADGEETFQAASGEVGRFAELRSASFELPTTPIRELKVWTHRVSVEGHSEALPARLELADAGGTQGLEPGPEGQVLAALSGGPCHVEIALP